MPLFPDIPTDEATRAAMTLTFMTSTNLIAWLGAATEAPRAVEVRKAMTWLVFGRCRDCVGNKSVIEGLQRDVQRLEAEAAASDARLQRVSPPARLTIFVHPTKRLLKIQYRQQNRMATAAEEDLIKAGFRVVGRSPEGDGARAARMQVAARCLIDQLVDRLGLAFVEFPVGEPDSSASHPFRSYAMMREDLPRLIEDVAKVFVAGMMRQTSTTDADVYNTANMLQSAAYWCFGVPPESNAADAYVCMGVS